MDANTGMSSLHNIEQFSLALCSYAAGGQTLLEQGVFFKSWFTHRLTGVQGIGIRPSNMRPPPKP